MVKMSPCHGVRSGFDSRNLRQKKVLLSIKSRVAPLIVKADLKHLTYVYTGGESDLKY